MEQPCAILVYKGSERNAMQSKECKLLSAPAWFAHIECAGLCDLAVGHVRGWHRGSILGPCTFLFRLLDRLLSTSSGIDMATSLSDFESASAYK